MEQTDLEKKLELAQKRGDEWYQAFQQKCELLAKAEKRLAIYELVIERLVERRNG